MNKQEVLDMLSDHEDWLQCHPQRDYFGAREHGFRADFSQEDLSRLDLRGLNFTEAEMYDCNLAGADLRGSIFVGTDLSGANFTGARVEGANFINAIGDIIVDKRDRMNYNTYITTGEYNMFDLNANLKSLGYLALFLLTVLFTCVLPALI